MLCDKQTKTFSLYYNCTYLLWLSRNFSETPLLYLCMYTSLGSVTQLQLNSILRICRQFDAASVKINRKHLLCDATSAKFNRTHLLCDATSVLLNRKHLLCDATSVLLNRKQLLCDATSVLLNRTHLLCDATSALLNRTHLLCDATRCRFSWSTASADSSFTGSCLQRTSSSAQFW
jgi:hypothetical protein